MAKARMRARRGGRVVRPGGVYPKDPRKSGPVVYGPPLVGGRKRKRTTKRK